MEEVGREGCVSERRNDGRGAAGEGRGVRRGGEGARALVTAGRTDGLARARLPRRVLLVQRLQHPRATRRGVPPEWSDPHAQSRAK